MIEISNGTMTRSMQESPINWALKTIVHPMFKTEEMRELFDERFWIGGDKCDDTDRRYLFYHFRTSDIADNYSIHEVVKTLQVVNVVLTLPNPTAIKLHPNDVRLLRQASEIKVIAKNGEPTGAYNLVLNRYEQDDDGEDYLTSDETYGFIHGTNLDRILARFKFQYRTQSVVNGQQRRDVGHIWFKEK